MEFKEFLLVAVYVPNAGEELKRLKYRIEEWDVDFRSYLITLINAKKPVIVIGDFNVVHQELDVVSLEFEEIYGCLTRDERHSFSKLFGNGFVDSFRYLYPQKV